MELMALKACPRGRFVCSWSGGKDSCMALHRARREGVPAKLFTMLEETGERGRSHALPLGFLKRQAEALGLRHETASAAWEGYEAAFVAALGRFAAEGAEAAVFGDIDLIDHGRWEERVCGEAGLSACLPLWLEDRRALAEEFIALGYRAVIVVVNGKLLDPRFLGREYTLELLGELRAEGADLCGENGEFHTAVLDGPIFRHPVEAAFGERYAREGYHFLPVQA